MNSHDPNTPVAWRYANPDGSWFVSTINRTDLQRVPLFTFPTEVADYKAAIMAAREALEGLGNYSALVGFMSQDQRDKNQDAMEKIRIALEETTK